MSDIVKQLRTLLPIIGVDRGLMVNAADEIERLQMKLRALRQDDGAVIAGLQAEIERMRTDNEKWRGLLEAKVTPGYELLANEIERGEVEIEQLQEELKKLEQQDADVTNMLVNENKRLHVYLYEQVDEIKRLRTLIQTLIDNDPDDMAADGVTVLGVWRKQAEALLSIGRKTG